MPQLSMEIEHPEDEEEQPGYLKQSDYLKKPKPQKPSSLKPVENTVDSEEPVEKPVKKKRVMSEKQKAALAKAREVSAKKRKEKKALEGTTKPVKAKKPMRTKKRDDDRMAREYEESIREDERKKLWEMTQHQQQSKPKKQVNAKAMLQTNMWEQAFAPKRSPFGF